MIHSKDWTGNSASIFKALGASSHADHERQSDDYYATEPKATEWLCRLSSLRAGYWSLRVARAT